MNHKTIKFQIYFSECQMEISARHAVRLTFEFSVVKISFKKMDEMAFIMSVIVFFQSITDSQIPAISKFNISHISFRIIGNQLKNNSNE